MGIALRMHRPKDISKFFADIADEEYLYEFINLESLDLSNNGLTSIPPEIGNLINLKRLKLYCNCLKDIPSEIGNLTNLQSLGLYSNCLKDIPPEIGQLINLEILTLNNNNLTTLPPEIGTLRNLKYLSLQNNQLIHLPDSMGDLLSLTELKLKCNKFTSIPVGLLKTAKIGIIDLTDNPFKRILVEGPDWKAFLLAHSHGECDGEGIPFGPEIMIDSNTPIFYDSLDFKRKRIQHVFDVYENDSNINPIPAEDYIPALLSGELDPKYYQRIIKGCSGEAKKFLLDKLAPNHKICPLLRHRLELSLKDGFRLQL